MFPFRFSQVGANRDKKGIVWEIWFVNIVLFCLVVVGGWSTAGCSLRGIVNDTIVCECNHMTNFAALVVSNLKEVLLNVSHFCSSFCGDNSQ